MRSCVPLLVVLFAASITLLPRGSDARSCHHRSHSSSSSGSDSGSGDSSSCSSSRSVEWSGSHEAKCGHHKHNEKCNSCKQKSSEDSSGSSSSSEEHTKHHRKLSPCGICNNVQHHHFHYWAPRRPVHAPWTHAPRSPHHWGAPACGCGRPHCRQRRVIAPSTKLSEGPWRSASGCDDDDDDGLFNPVRLRPSGKSFDSGSWSGENLRHHVFGTHNSDGKLENLSSGSPENYDNDNEFDFIQAGINARSLAKRTPLHGELAGCPAHPFGCPAHPFGCPAHPSKHHSRNRRHHHKKHQHCGCRTSRHHHSSTSLTRHHSFFGGLPFAYDPYY